MIEQTPAPAEKTRQIVVFELDREEYAIPIEDVREVIKIPEITLIPNSPAYISGIINLRGQVYSIINLETRFQLVRANTNIKPVHIVIVDAPASPFGVIVDQVSEVLRLPESWIQPTPDTVGSKIGLEFVKGVVVVKSEPEIATGQEPRILLLLNLKEILSKQELAGLNSKTAEEKHV